MTAGWYTGGAVPGEVGAAVIIGHNDTRFGKAVFHDLKKITKGADITVTDASGDDRPLHRHGHGERRQERLPHGEGLRPDPGPCPAAHHLRRRLRRAGPSGEQPHRVRDAELRRSMRNITCRIRPDVTCNVQTVPA